jgi:nitrilase
VVRIAIAQDPPSVLDLTAGVRRAASIIGTAAADGAGLVAFPETWLTGYPSWVFGLAGWDDPEARRWYARLLEESPSAGDPRLAPLPRCPRLPGGPARWAGLLGALATAPGRS